jgi:glycosyltransferase involved in cell wall biosynthesis
MNQFSKVSISIIIPAFNEEERLPACLEKTLKFCKESEWDAEIIIAEDGSTDNTVKIVQEFQKNNTEIKLISFKDRLGKGKSIKNAILQGTKKFVGFMDADLSADPSEFKRLIEKMPNFDIAIGSRLLRDGLPPIKRPWTRTVSSLLYSKFFRVLFRNPVIDPQCGFKLFRREVIPTIFNEIKTTGFAFDSEIVVKAYSLGLKIVEVPIIWSHDNASKVTIRKQVFEMGGSLLTIWYEAHILWLDHKRVYPQKKGTLIGKILFKILSMLKS